MQDLVASAAVAASWHISCSLPGSGSWLHTMLYVNRVAAKTWRAMLCLRMMAPIPEATGIDRCVSGCSCTGWQLQLGFHWMSGCEMLSYNTAWHNPVGAVLRKLFEKIGWETRLKEQAGWVVGAPDLRPYDVPARPDSSTPWMGTVLMLQWLIHLGMATSALVSATSRRRQLQQGMSIGCSLGTVSVTWSAILRWTSRLLVAL